MCRLIPDLDHVARWNPLKIHHVGTDSCVGSAICESGWISPTQRHLEHQDIPNTKPTIIQYMT